MVQNPNVLYKTLLITAQILTFPPDKRGSCSSSRMRFQTFFFFFEKSKLVLGFFLLAHELFPFCFQNKMFAYEVSEGLVPIQLTRAMIGENPGNYSDGRHTTSLLISKEVSKQLNKGAGRSQRKANGVKG